MSWRDAIVFAARGVRRRIGRAVLTVAAIALASALLSSLLIAGGVARTWVLDDVSKGGPLAGIRVDAAQPVVGELQDGSGQDIHGAPKTIDDAAIASIAKLAEVRSVLSVMVQPVLVIPPQPAVVAAAPAKVRRTNAVSKPFPYTDGLVGADLSKASELPVTMLAGRLPQPGSMTEVAVTDGYLRELGLHDNQSKLVVGTELEYGSARVFRALGAQSARGRWVRAEIVGVVAQDVDSHESVLAPIEAVRAARAWTTTGDDPSELGTPQSPYAALFVVADSLAAVPRVRQRITQAGYANSAPETVIANVQRYVHVVEIVLGGIGLIGLIIAALGISNAMLAAVRERRREIGVMKAIGARDRDVRRVFLLEAAFLGALGGAVGTFLGWGIARTLAAVVNNFLQSQGLAGVGVNLPLRVFAIGVFGAAALALVAGTIPAVRAARLPARQAMGDR